MKNFIFAFIFLSSCINKDTLKPTSYIYITKGDYINLVCCILKEDNLHIMTIKGTNSQNKRIKLIQNYILNNDGLKFGKNNVAFLDLTQNEYRKKFEIDSNYKGFTDTLEKHILDKDPFIELYAVNNYDISDTAKLNKIIKKGELEKYFERIK
jgi:hypothetical protein